MCAKLLLAIVALCSVQQIAAAAANEYATLEDDRQLNAFIGEVEELVLNTTDRALIVTANVYRNLSAAMSPQLLQATGKIMRDYVAAVNASLASGANFTEKRKLFKQFKLNNFRIDQLRLQWDPLQPQFEFQLISEAFYNEAPRNNCTEFDNLYLEFMNRFERASQQLWDTMSERTVEEQEELLEILDEIASERQLREKDKLYDEFIEMYLFKPVGGEVENRELF